MGRTVCGVCWMERCECRPRWTAEFIGENGGLDAVCNELSALRSRVEELEGKLADERKAGDEMAEAIEECMQKRAMKLGRMSCAVTLYRKARSEQ